MSRQCSRCKEMKDDFPHKKSYCRQCGNEMCRDYKRRNREKIAAYNKEYKSEHKEEISTYNHIYNIENREEIQKRQTRTHKERRETDENYKLASDLRRKLLSDIKKEFNISDLFSNKKYSCGSDLIKKWFESLFTEEMNWENHGTVWHTDHIKPCCSFDLTNEEQKKEAFHWSNLRPAIALENQKKTGKIDEELIKQYKIIANKFLEEYNGNL